MGKTYGHMISGGRAGGADRGGVRGRAVEEVLVGPGPLTADDGYGVGGGQRTINNRPLQSDWSAGDRSDPADGRVRFHRDGAAIRQGQEEVPHTGEGILVPITAQGFVTDVPTHLELPVEFEDLTVDEYLRGLGQALDGPAAKTRQGIAAADTEHGGENEGEERSLPAATAGDLTDDLNATDVVVVEVLPQLMVYPADNLLNAVGSARIDEHRNGGGEVADDALEVIVQGKRHERGDVEREARSASPTSQGGAVDGEQETCR